jgi:formate-dependent nitrite reductase membrane component NrfD
VLGILGVLTFWLLGLGAVLGLVAIILGVIGLRRVRSGQATNRTSAIAGIVLGAIAIALLIFTIGRVLDEFGSEFDNFSDCASAANTQAERDQCVRDFQDQVSR